MFLFLLTIVVALLDTGVFAEHKHFSETTILGDRVDVCGQGTALAGVIVEEAPQAVLLSVDVEENCMTTHRKLGNAIRQAVDNNADIVVVAWNVTPTISFYAEAVEYATSKGVIVLTGDSQKYASRNVPVLDGTYRWATDSGVFLAEKTGEIARYMGKEYIYLPIIGRAQ